MRNCLNCGKKRKCEWGFCDECYELLEKIPNWKELLQ